MKKKVQKIICLALALLFLLPLPLFAMATNFDNSDDILHVEDLENLPQEELQELFFIPEEIAFLNSTRFFMGHYRPWHDNCLERKHRNNSH